MMAFRPAIIPCVVLAVLAGTIPAMRHAAADSPKSLYDSACAACHGPDGRGRSQSELGFDIALPDFADCSFATREPDADWYAVIHQGGPVRVFDRMMPAFGEALTRREIEQILAYVRGFCTDARWPRGELNLPRALFTEKAYPEDEAVATVSVPEGGDDLEVELLYEKRFGPRTQIEVSLPLLSLKPESVGGREQGIGDLAVGIKQNVFHDLVGGSIFSVGAEVILPTGDDDRGLGRGTTIVEPFLLFGKMLPNDMFFQAQALGEFATEGEESDEISLRTALGRTWSSGARGFGRAWSPMIEALVFRETERGADTYVDLVPQLQVTLSTRQHVIFNAGLRIPVNHTDQRETELVIYLLWDWFDGGITEGW